MVDYDTFRRLVAGTSINPETLLATDYLNRFAGIAMLLEMLATMPDLLAEALAWEPCSYREHFAEGGLTFAPLAIAAYDHVPTHVRHAFEATVARMNDAVAEGLSLIEAADTANDVAAFATLCRGTACTLNDLIGAANAIIHSDVHALDQAGIDACLVEPPSAREHHVTADDGEIDVDVLDALGRNG